MNFDEVIDRRGHLSAKWDKAAQMFDLRDPATCLPMWVADMDFRPPEAVRRAMQELVDHGIYGYQGVLTPYLEAIRWWMDTRHGWQVEPDQILSAHGLVNACGLVMQAFSQPGDGVVLFTPVYHAFKRVIDAAGREAVEIPLTRDADGYAIDFDLADRSMTGREKILFFCSPHNPVGRVWRRDELEAVAAFARRHDLILVSDEIHHDLVLPGHRHIPMPHIDGVEDRLVMLTAASKTFNLAGHHIGNMIVPDEKLRGALTRVMAGLAVSTNIAGTACVTAAYSPEGAAWCDALVDYLDGNRALFARAIASIPGLTMAPLEGTYLAWVDFAGTGMEQAEFIRRVEKEANIAANHGAAFGPGGETFLRFNLGMPRAQIAEAADRLKSAFADLQ